MENQNLITDDVLANKIYNIRGQKVMLDADLAELYNIPVKRLNEQVKRNKERFPPHFRFVLTKLEMEGLRSQDATLEMGKYSKYLASAYTEHGILMLSNVLKSGRAIEMSIRIIDVFVKMRQILSADYEIRQEIEEIKKVLNNQGQI